MSIHLMKLCVGAEDIDDVKHWQQRVMAERARLGQSSNPIHETRQMPKRADELLDGGSIYWVVKGAILLRQRIFGVEGIVDIHGKPFCRLVLDPELIETDPTPKRPFQGWRYLKPDEAPADLTNRAVKDVPKPLVRALKEAGVW